MNTKHPQKHAVATIYEPTLEFEERIRRASAPTLRDLQVVLMEPHNELSHMRGQGFDKPKTCLETQGLETSG